MLSPEQEILYYDKICRIVDEATCESHLWVADNMTERMKSVVSKDNNGLIPVLKDKIMYKSLEMEYERI